MLKKAEIKTENGSNIDAKLRIEEDNGKITLYVKAEKTRPRYIELLFNMKFDDNAVFLGDAWERSYADLFWNSRDNLRSMPWYFLCKEEEKIRREVYKLIYGTVAKNGQRKKGLLDKAEFALELLFSKDPKAIEPPHYIAEALKWLQDILVANESCDFLSGDET